MVLDIGLDRMIFSVVLDYEPEHVLSDDIVEGDNDVFVLTVFTDNIQAEILEPEYIAIIMYTPA